MGEEFKFHLVSWIKVCTPIVEGGLGGSEFTCVQRARLGKRLWRYVHERDALWRVVVDSKYASAWGGWCSNEFHGSYGVGHWKNIRRGWEELSSHTRFEMGDGSKIQF
jgi:hypothetical protein